MASVNEAQQLKYLANSIIFVDDSLTVSLTTINIPMQTYI